MTRLYLLLFLSKGSSQCFKEAKEHSTVDAIGQGTRTNSPARDQQSITQKTLRRQHLCGCHIVHAQTKGHSTLPTLGSRIEKSMHNCSNVTPEEILGTALGKHSTPGTQHGGTRCCCTHHVCLDHIQWSCGCSCKGSSTSTHSKVFLQEQQLVLVCIGKISRCTRYVFLTHEGQPTIKLL